MARLGDAFKNALEDPEYLSVTNKLILSTEYLGAADYEKWLRSDFEDIGKLVRKLGLDKQ